MASSSDITACHDLPVCVNVLLLMLWLVVTAMLVLVTHAAAYQLGTLAHDNGIAEDADAWE